MTLCLIVQSPRVGQESSSVLQDAVFLAVSNVILRTTVETSQMRLAVSMWPVPFHSSAVIMDAVFLPPGSVTQRTIVVMAQMKETSVQKRHVLIFRYKVWCNDRWDLHRPGKWLLYFSLLQKHSVRFFFFWVIFSTLWQFPLILSFKN